MRNLERLITILIPIMRKVTKRQAILSILLTSSPLKMKNLMKTLTLKSMLTLVSSELRKRRSNLLMKTLRLLKKFRLNLLMMIMILMRLLKPELSLRRCLEMAKKK